MHNSSGLTPVSSWLNWIMDMVVLTSAFPHFTFSSVDNNLGVTLDKELTLDSHIYSLCRTCYYQLRQLRTDARSPTSIATATLGHSFVTALLGYCSSQAMYSPCPV